MNNTLFANRKRTPPTDTRNAAGGTAYSMTAKEGLAQLAATGCFGDTYYTSAKSQLDLVVKLAKEVDDMYLAQLAIYSRGKAFMKDMPVVLLALLANRNIGLFHTVFPKVVDNGKMLRNFFQIIRSGIAGKKSLSYAVKKDVNNWLLNAKPGTLLSGSIGNNPSLADVIKCAHPKPQSAEQSAMFRYILGHDLGYEHAMCLPDVAKKVRAIQACKDGDQQAELINGWVDRREYMPRWDLLSTHVKGQSAWKALSRTMNHQALRMNLNTLDRHGVLADPEMVEYVAGKIGNKEEVKSARQFPYQYFSAYRYAGASVPHAIKRALNNATEYALENVPAFDGPVLVGVDLSWSMRSPVTGRRGRGTTQIQCSDVAALYAAAVLKKNPDSLIIGFDQRVYHITPNPDDTILTIADQLSKIGGGGTDCSLPFKAVVQNPQLMKNSHLIGAVLISDNESWINHCNHRIWGTSQRATPAMEEWEKLRNLIRHTGGPKNPKLVCIDIVPNTTAQVKSSEDVLNVGGFNDQVFKVASDFINGTTSFVDAVESIDIW